MAHEIIQSLVTLLFLSALVAMAVRQRDLPYTVILVVLGLVMGLFHLEPALHFTPDLLLLGFLPALLFEAAWNLHFDQLKANGLVIGVLAVLGVLVAAGVVAGVLGGLGLLSWGLAWLFGAMVAATDPVAVVAIFRTLGLSPRLATLLEGESLFNDGTAVVLFQIIAGIVLGSQPVTWTGVLGGFGLTVLGGAAVGLALGFGCSRLIIQAEDHLVDITLTTVAAYGTYLIADALHVSAIIAVIVAGLVVAHYGQPRGMSEASQAAVGLFWEYAAFVANSLVFLLMGTQIELASFGPALPALAVAIAAMLLGRGLVIYPIVALSNALGPASRRISRLWQHVLVWGGLRGALSMALVMSLPPLTPFRQTLVHLVFGAVLFSLLVQGTTIGPWLTRLRRDPRHDLGAAGSPGTRA